MSDYAGFRGGRSPRLRPRLSITGSEPENPYDRPLRPRGGNLSGTMGRLPSPPGAPSIAPPRNQSLPQSAFELAAPDYQRPRSALGWIIRAMGVPENIGVAFDRAMHEGNDDKGFPPWVYLKALGMGFKEIPSAISEDAEYSDFLRERSDPDSFWYKHADAVGLTMAVFFDPTMYLTFGGTGAAKVAARVHWSRGVAESADEARKAIASGRTYTYGPLKGRTFSPKDDFNTVLAEVHIAHGRPVSFGDSLDALQKIDKAGQAGVFRQIFPRGGRGTRFAGLEIPGTREAGEQMAKFFRSKTDDLLSNKGTTDFFARAFIPDAALHGIGSDLIRTVAVLENSLVRRQTAAQAERVTKLTQRIALLDNPIAQQASGILGQPTKSVPIAKRLGVLRQPGRHPDPTVAKLMSNAYLQKATAIRDAKRVGMDEKQIREINQLWARLVKDIDDPIQVTAQFVSRTSGRILAYEQIARIINNPILSRRIDEAPFLDPAATTAYARQTGQQGMIVRSAEAFENMTMLGAAVKQGTVPFKWQGKTYAVHVAVAEALEQLKNPAFLDFEMSRFFKMINGPQNLWKIPATVLNPSFHMMNVVGGMWNNMLAGPYGPVDHLETWARVAQKRIAEGVSKGRMSGPVLATAKATALRSAAGKKSLILRRERENRLATDIITPFEERGRGGANFTREVSGDISREIARTGDRPFLPRVTLKPGVPRISETGRIFTAARRTTAGLGAAEIATNLAAYNGWIEDFDIPGGNEFWGVLGFAPELTRGGRFISSYTEEVLRLTPFQEAWKDKGLRQLMESVGPTTPPNFAKMAPKGLTKKQEAALFDIGTEITVRYQFDYSHLTQIERTVAKMFFPFWTFYKNNFILQTKEILNRPRFVQGFYHMANYIEEEFGDDLSPEMEQLLPEYFENLGAFQVPVPNWARDKLGLPQETPLFLNPKLPFVSLNLFPPLWELFNTKSVTPWPTRLLQVMAPIAGSVGPFAGPVPGAKLMFETALGVNMGLARPIDYQRASSGDWRQSFTHAPGYTKYLPGPLNDLFSVIQDPETKVNIMPATWKYVMDTMSTPFISNYGKVVPTGESGERGSKARADMVAWMTGIRLMPVDPLKISRSWAYRLQSMLEARKAERAEQGLELEPDDDLTYRRLRLVIKGIEKQWDDREAELYGTK